MNQAESLREAHDLPLDREEIAVDADAFERIRGNVDRGVECWVSVVVVDGDGRVALVNNAWSDGWIPPGGSTEPGEGLRAAAVREVREETGVEATVEAPVAVVEETFECGGRTVSGRRVVFAAHAVTTALADDPGLDGEGIEAVQWFGQLPGRLEQRALVEQGRAALSSGPPGRESAPGRDSRRPED